MKKCLVFALLWIFPARAQDLHRMILKGDLEQFQIQLRQVDLEQLDNNGETALHWAIEARRPDMALLLLQQGASPDTPDRNRQAPLFKAAREGQLEVVRFLLKAGAQVDRPDYINETPLLRACLYNRPQVVELLLQHGASPHTADRLSRRTAVHAACTYGADRCLDLLIQAGAELNVLDSEGNSPLHLAGWCGSLPCAQRLLQAHLDPDRSNDKGETPLMLALSRNHQPLVAYLAERSYLTEAVLKVAVTKGNLDLLRRVDHAPPSLLPLAAAEGRQEIVELLLSQGIPVDSPDDQGRSAYLTAAGTGRRGLMELLSAQGADPERRDSAGMGAVELVQAHIRSTEFRLERESRSRALSPHLSELEADLERSRATLLWLQKV